MAIYLPVGSVVLLKGGKKRLVIYGRKQREIDTGKEWDYLACPYPEGYVSQEHTYVFNEDQIETVFFLGYHDQEDADFQKLLSSQPAADTDARGSGILQ